MGPEGRRLSRRPGRRGARLRPDHRQGGREVQGGPARRVHDRRQRRDHPRPAHRLQQAEHRRLRLLSRMTVRDSTSRPASAVTRPGQRARVGVFGIGLTPTGPSSPGSRSASRAISAAWRRRSPPSAARSCPRDSSTPRRRRREAGDRFAAAQVDLVLCHAVTYATSSTVLPVAQAAGVAGRAARPAAHRDARLREHRHGRVAGQLRGLLRAGARRRVHARADPLRHRRGHDRRRPARVGEDRRLGARGGRGARAAALADRLPRPRLSGHARHVHGLHGGPRAGRRARRAARDRRPGSARGGGDRRRGRGQGGGDPRDVRLRRSLGGSDRRADRARAARLVRARGRRARPARGRLRARRADLLLPRRRTATRPSGWGPA